MASLLRLRWISWSEPNYTSDRACRSTHFKYTQLIYLRRIGDDEILRSSRYWLTEGEYPKPADVHHEKRIGIESRSVSVAIPLDWEQRGGPKGMLFAYLPVWEETGLPFLINADFLLVSSREGIREYEAWNTWLRDCVAETFTKSFLALVNCPDVARTGRLSAYGSIPLESHRPFLSPIIDTIHRVLAGHECVMVMPDNATALPSNARLSDQNLRRVLQATGRLPNYLCAEVQLVLPELEDYKGQLAALGISRLSSSEIVSILQDDDWLREHDVQWFVDLFVYLSSQRLEASAWRRLKVVPVTSDDGQSWRLSCDREQPIYFHCSEADEDALASVPKWLSSMVPIAFLDEGLWGVLSRYEDQENLCEWMTETLGIYHFSIENYCVDVLSKISKEYGTLSIEQLVEATAFLAHNVERDFDWVCLKLVEPGSCC